MLSVCSAKTMVFCTTVAVFRRDGLWGELSSASADVLVCMFEYFTCVKTHLTSLFLLM